MKDYLDRIHHCVTAVGKWIIESNSTPAIPLKRDNLDYFFINENEAKWMNGYKELLKEIGLSQNRIQKESFGSENS